MLLPTVSWSVCLGVKSETIADLMPSSGIHLDTCCTLVPSAADFRTWRWRWYIPPKHLFIYGLHSAVSRKMATFITTAVRSSNPTITGLLMWGVLSDEKSQSLSGQSPAGLIIFHCLRFEIPPLWSGQGQGQGYITTNSQSVSVSWCRAQSRTIDQSFSPWNFI
jgi:hypothetical protein